MARTVKCDDEKLGIKILDTWAEAIDNVMEERPDITAFCLLKAFQVKRAQTVVLPDRKTLPSARLASRLALKSVTDALEHPDDVVLTSIFLPNELFQAMGLYPLMAEALANFVTGAHAEPSFVQAAEQNGVPETYCSFHKVLLGGAFAGVIEPVRFIANCSVACDANNISFKLLARRFGCPHVYVDVPPEYSEESCSYVAGQLEALGTQLQEAYGRALDPDLLVEHVARSQRTLKNLVRTLPLRPTRFIKNGMGLEMQHALAFHALLGTEDVEHLSKLMLRDYREADGYDGLNLLWSATAPFFSSPLQRVLDSNTSQQIVASDMCFDQVSFEPWAHGPDEPYLAMAERLIKNAYNGGAERRAEQLRRVAERCDADGCVVFCHWGCKETMGASQIIRQTLEAEGRPVLVLDGDGCNRANFPDGQAATRLEAFLEMLEAERAEKPDNDEEVA